jgi:hypothetical protein
MEMTSRVQTAINELAADAVSRQFRQAITLEQARRHVDSELQAEWIGTAIAVQSPHNVIGEFLTERMTDAEAVSFLSAASLSFSSTTQHEYIGKRVGDMLRDYIADDLRRDAELAADKLERDGPRDEEIYAAYFSEELPPLRVVLS